MAGFNNINNRRVHSNARGCLHPSFPPLTSTHDEQLSHRLLNILIVNT